MTDYGVTSNYITTNKITVSTSNVLSSTVAYAPYTTTIGTLDLKPYNPQYKCPYCDTIHDHRTGVCDRCGAPMSEAKEIQ